MKISGVIAEYNPFHNGHAVQLDAMRRAGATHIVCVLGGHFTQRGDLSVLTKWARAQMALACGADLVIELPLPWAMAPAERFALGGLALLDGLGCVEQIAFGSECGDASLLCRAAAAAQDSQTAGLIQSGLKQGLPLARARQHAVEALYGEQTARCFTSPNDILAICYLNAIKQLGSSITPLPVPRVGAGHDQGACGIFASASHLRKLLSQGKEIAPYLPPSSLQILKEQRCLGRAPVLLSALQQAILGRLRALREDELEQLPDLSEGIERRLASAIVKSHSLEELFSLMKVKRYPLARVRRLCLAAAVGIRQSHCEGTPPYLRVLGLNERGQQVLRAAKATAKLPVIHKFSMLSRQNGAPRELCLLESHATDLYSLAFQPAGNCSLEYTQPVITSKVPQNQEVY